MREEKLDDFFCTYLQSVCDGMDLPEDRCAEVDQGHHKGCRCLKTNGHGGQHQWTPRHAISRSTALKIMKILTPKEIVSLAGLDDIATTAGYLNYIKLRDQTTALHHAGYLNGEKCAVLTSIIDESESFFKKEYLEMLSLEHECIHLCMKGGFTPPPPAVVVGGGEEEEEQEEEEEEQEQTIVFPTREEEDPEAFSFTQESNGTDDYLGLVFKDTKDSRLNGKLVYFVCTGVTEDPADIIYRQIQLTRLSTVEQHTVFEHIDESTIKERSMKQLFFEDKDYEFFGKGADGVKAAQKLMREHKDAQSGGGGDGDGESSEESGESGSEEDVVEDFKELNKSQLMKKLKKLTKKRLKKVEQDGESMYLAQARKETLRLRLVDIRLNGFIVEEGNDGNSDIPDELTAPEEHEKLECTNHEHKYELQEMVNIERVFAQLKDLADKFVVDTTPGEGEEGNANDDRFDRALEIQASMVECQTTFYSYLGHMVRSKREEMMRKKRREDLKEGEAIVTTDWKMKLLAMMFREGSKEWYGKKGISCIGLMVLQRIPAALEPSTLGKSTELKGDFMVSFYDLITDDPKQDAYSVACAKMKVFVALRDHVNPLLRVHTIYEEEDGAGCFGGVFGRNSIRHYEDWTFDDDTDRCVKVIAVSFGEPQTNKSFLDTHFAYVGAAITKGVTVSKGEAVDAASCQSALERANLQSSHCWVMQPNREFQATFESRKQIDFAKASYTKVVDVVIGGHQYKGLLSRNYGMGPWTFHSEEELNKCWPNGTPVRPRCKLEEDSDDDDSNDDDDDVGGESAKKKMRKMPSVRPNGISKDRKELKRKSLNDKKSEAIQNKAAKMLAGRESVFFLCTHREDGARCKKQFTYKANLTKHMAIDEESGERTGSACVFPTKKLIDRVVSIGSDAEKCMELNARNRVYVNANKSFAPVLRANIQPSVPGFNHVYSNQQLGQFRKKNTTNRVKFTPTQNEFIQRQYNIGVEDPDKRVPNSTVQQNMRNMRMNETQRNVFNRRKDNAHGHVLDIPRLKQSFSKIKREQGKQPMHPRFAFWKTKPVDELRQRVGGDTSNKSKNDLAKELAEVDRIGGYKHGFVGGFYVDTPEN